MDFKKMAIIGLVAVVVMAIVFRVTSIRTIVLGA